jgi:hypothetical protein
MVRVLMKNSAAISGLVRPSPGRPDDVLLLRGELAVGVDLALADLLAGGKQFPVSWHPVRERDRERNQALAVPRLVAAR